MVSRAGVCNRIEDVAGDDVARVRALDDAIADVAAREDPARFVVAPHVILEDPRIGTADGDDARFLRLLNVVELRFVRFGVVGVCLEQLDEFAVHG